MTGEEKKIRMLLKSVIYHYHGLDELEKVDLEETSRLLDAPEEFKWAIDFVTQDYITAFDRAQEYMHEIINDYPMEKRTELISMVWESNNLKGYVTEMEATAMIKLAKDWKVESEFTKLILG